MNWHGLLAFIRDAMAGGLVVWMWYDYREWRAKMALREVIDAAAKAPGIERTRVKAINDIRRWRISAGLEPMPVDLSEWLHLYRHAPGRPRFRGRDALYYLCVGQGEAAWGETPGEAYRDWLRDVRASRTAS
jgi:hypothetical protein